MATHGITADVFLELGSVTIDENNTSMNEGLRGNVDDGEINFCSLLLIVVPVWILSGNFLVFTAVIRQKSLRTLSNWVIASLAFTDFLLALLVVPLGVYQLVVGQWKLGLYVCLLWTGSDVVLSTTSIMHLCAIALYRYSGIAHPLRMRSTQEMRHVVALVAPSWLIAVTLSIPFAIQGAFDSSHVLLSLPGHRGGGVACGIFNRTFAIYSSLVSFFIPLMIMIFADIRSIQILRNNVVLGLPVQTGNSSKRSRRRRTSAETEVEDNFSTTEIREQSPLRRDPSTADEDRGRIGGGKCAMAPRPTIHHKFNPSEKNLLPHASRMSLPSDVMMQQITNNQTGSDRFRQADTPYVFRGTQSARPKSVIYISMLTSGRGRVKTNSRERRAERTLIWVFVAFVALWLPFFCVNLTYGLCAHCSIPDGLFALFTWLGYFSSGVNPCIYTYLNKDFRNAFKNILTCKRFGPTRFPRQYS